MSFVSLGSLKDHKKTMSIKKTWRKLLDKVEDSFSETESAVSTLVRPHKVLHLPNYKKGTLTSSFLFRSQQRKRYLLRKKNVKKERKKRKKRMTILPSPVAVWDQTGRAPKWHRAPARMTLRPSS